MPPKNDREAERVAELESRIALLEAESRALRASFAVLNFKPDGTVIDCNEVFCETTGFTPEAIKGKPHSTFMHPEDAAHPSYESFMQSLQRGESYRGAVRRINAQGEIVWYLAAYSPVIDQSGQVSYIVKHAFDISEEKAKQAQREIERSTVNQVFAIINFKPDGTILGANPLFCQTMGYSQEQIRGKHHRMFTDPELSASKEYAQFWRELAQGETRPGTYRRIKASGEEIYLRSIYAPIRDQHGRVQTIVKYALDGTAETLLQQRIEALVEDVSRVMEHIAEGDLTNRIHQDYGEQFQPVCQAINTTCDRLSQMT